MKNDCDCHVDWEATFRASRRRLRWIAIVVGTVVVAVAVLSVAIYVKATRQVIKDTGLDDTSAAKP